MKTASDEIEARASEGDVKAQLALAHRLDAQGMRERARAWLTRGAKSGDPEAKAELGLNLMLREPYDAVLGVEWTRQAAAQGYAKAQHLLALFSAAGVRVPQNWRLALDLLRRAAEGGYPPAQRGLAALAGHWDLARDSGRLASWSAASWKELSGTVAIEQWLTPPPARAVAPNPRVFLIDGFLSHPVCDWLIDFARPRLAPAQTFSTATGALDYEEGRTNSAAQIPLTEGDMVLMAVRARILASLGLPGVSLEDSSVLHYATGEEYRPHFDFFDASLPGTASEVATWGQRVLTFLIYLNEGFEGGETGFPRIGQAFKGRKGDALVFWNVKPDLTPDEMSLHAGTAPVRGEKWLFSQWVRYRAA